MMYRFSVALVLLILKAVTSQLSDQHCSMNEEGLICECSRVDNTNGRVDFSNPTTNFNCRMLTFKDSKLPTIPANVFALSSSIYIFNAVEVGISRISAANFASGYGIIRLSRNAISALPSRVFSEVSKLRELYLDSNGIENLAEDAFAGLSALEYLDLGNNTIATLKPRLFDDLSGLKTLVLKRNKIGYIPPTLFGSLSGLQSLHLDDNSLVFNSEGGNAVGESQSPVLSALRNLVYLSLAGNQFETIGSSVFSHMKELVALNLMNCGVKCIDRAAFAENQDLQLLNLSKNKIRQVDLSDLGGFRKLYLAKSSLADFNYESLTSLKNLKEVDLTGNYFNCSYFSAMAQHLKDNNIVLTKDLVLYDEYNYLGVNCLDEDTLYECSRVPANYNCYEIYFDEVVF